MNGKVKRNKKNDLMKVRFSIGAKLITIITIIVLLSLGSITALVSWLGRQDVQVAAEENNFEINRRSAMEADADFTKIRFDSIMLMQVVSVLGLASDAAQETVDFFFEENTQTAALIFSVPEQAEMLMVVSNRFFQARGIETELVNSFSENYAQAISRAAQGETVLLNAAPHFGAAILAMFFPWQNWGGCVLFSPGNLVDNFAFGTNQSYLINDSGDILIHADFDLVRNGANVADGSFTRFAWNSTARNMQTRYTDEEGVSYFGAFYKLNTAGCTVITSIEYDKVFEGIVATTRRNIYLTAAVLFISIMLIWFFAKSISVPLKALAKAAHTIEGGTFEIDIRPKSRDEVGVLTASFNRMCSALNIFGKFTNRDIAIQAMRGEIKPGGLHKHATIFFSDIRNFTSISEKFVNTFGSDASDRIVYWLNAYLTQMVESVEKTGGIVDKFIGDAVMAHWGTASTSGSPDRDAYNCVKAAIMMRKAVYEMNKLRNPDDDGNPPIAIGCGINTGIVTAGQIGSDLRMEYTVIGDPVNLASRIESLNKPLGTDILISEDTWNLVKDKFITEEMPSVTVKGKEEPLRVFAVINFSGVDKGPMNLADVRKLLGIKAPNLSTDKINADEKKYKIDAAK